MGTAYERFESFVSPEPLTGCWLWTGGYTGNGYPIMSLDGKAKRANRFSYEEHKGEIYVGNVIRHLCHTPSCVNPAHLEQGTQFQNVEDSLYSGRLNIKLTNEDVLNILKEYKPYEVSLKQLATKYGCSKRNILDIVKGRKFRNLYAQHMKGLNDKTAY